MPNIGISELLVVLMILLLVFGATRLPQLGEGLGRAIRNFKRGLASEDRIAVRKPEPGAAPPKTAEGNAPSVEAEDAELVDRND